MVSCGKCSGCGQVANTDREEPWTEWLKLPLQSRLSVQIGIVKAIECPICKGSGLKEKQDG